jgi:hypothetical protein
MNCFLIGLRVLVFLVALGGVAGSGFLGYKWRSMVDDPGAIGGRKEIVAARLMAKQGHKNFVIDQLLAKDRQKLYERNIQQIRIWPYVLAAAGVGLLGAFLALFGRTTSAALLLLVAPAGPAVLTWFWMEHVPEERAEFFLFLGLFTGGIPLAGLGALFVSFLAFVTRPKDEADQDGEDAKPAKGKTGPKRKIAVDEDEDEETATTTKPAAKRKKIGDEDDEDADTRTTPKRKRG